MPRSKATRKVKKLSFLVEIVPSSDLERLTMLQYNLYKRNATLLVYVNYQVMNGKNGRALFEVEF